MTRPSEILQQMLYINDRLSFPTEQAISTTTATLQRRIYKQHNEEYDDAPPATSYYMMWSARKP